jgi:sugar lactone lactonase YvrE
VTGVYLGDRYGEECGESIHEATGSFNPSSLSPVRGRRYHQGDEARSQAIIMYMGSNIIHTGNIVIIALGALCLSVMYGCVSAERTQEMTAPAVVQWPTVKPAITFVRSISSFESPKKGFFQEIGSLITGRKTREEGIVKPVAVSVSREGSIAVADPANGLVHYHNGITGKYRSISSVKSKEDLLVSPVGVAFGRRSRLYVSDSFRREVYAFDREGKHLFTIKDSGDGPFKRPTGLAYNAKRDILYVVDTLGNRIHIYTDEGRFQSSFGRTGTSQGEFNFPTYIFSDERGFLFVTDAMNFRVQSFRAEGEFVGEFGNHGDGSGDFSMPKGIAVDSRGVIYVVDSLFDNVQLFHGDGKLLLTVGQQGTESGEFWLPSGAFIDHSGNFYVCDTYNRRVQVFKIEDVHFQCC